MRILQKKLILLNREFLVPNYRKKCGKTIDNLSNKKKVILLTNNSIDLFKKYTTFTQFK